MKPVTYLLVLLSAAILWPRPAFSADQNQKPSPITLTRDESLMMCCINSERRSRGLPELTVDPTLVEVARLHSADMAKRKYFSHLAPGASLHTPMDRYAAVLGKQPRTVLGENLGCCDQPIMGLIHNGMMASPDHKANILDKEYVSAGVGVYLMDDGRVWVTQMFRGKLSERALGPTQ